MSAEKFLSIVIPSYNSKNWITKCLNSLSDQAQREDVEVIVVDSSKEDIEGFLLEKYPFISFVRLSERTYPGKARTIGIGRTNGSVIAFIDTDCIACEGWVSKIIEAHKNGKNVVGGPIKNATPKNLVGSAEYLLEFSEMIPAMPEGKVRFIPTCNISFKKNIFNQIGKLEDTIKGSDALFCRKISLLGESIFFKRDITVAHYNRTSFKKYMKNQYDLGFGGAQVRTLEEQVGAILIKAPILIPLIPGARTFLIGRRLLKNDKKLFFHFILVYPLIFWGLLAYTKGFWDGFLKTKKKDD